MWIRSPMAWLCAAVLAACSGGDSNPDNGGAPIEPPPAEAGRFSCMPVGGGQATISSFCLVCPGNAVQDKGKAIDTLLDTAATVKLHNADDLAGQQSALSLRATAQSGVAFPAGSRAGLILGLPEARQVPFVVGIATYLGGSLQESFQRSSTQINGDGPAYLGFDANASTTKPFDAVELSLSQAGGALEAQQFEIFEFCADGGPRAE